MVSRVYTPGRRDIVWIDFEPSRGHEQAHVRPALVLSPKDYNQKTGLMVACPITSQVKGYTYEVAIRDGELSGVVLVDQIRSLDWHDRKVRFIQKTTVAVIEEVEEKISTLLLN